MTKKSDVSIRDFKSRPKDILSYQIIKQKFATKIDVESLDVAVAFANESQFTVSLKSITKPEAKEVGNTLDLILLDQLSVSLDLEDKKWDIIKLDSLSVKETYEAMPSDVFVPISRHEREKKKIMERQLKTQNKTPITNPQENSYYRNRANMVELNSLLITVPFHLDPYLDSFSEIATAFLRDSSSPKKSQHVETSKENTEIYMEKRLFALFEHKYYLCFNGFKLVIEDNPFEVA
jgi:hypothetical protein